MKKLKILAAGDIHGDSGLAKSLAEKAERKNKKVLLIPGNHDSLATVDFLAEFYGVKNIHGYSVKYEDVGIFGCSGVNIGINSLEEEEIFSLLKKSHNGIKYLRKKIMVTHTPPTGSKMEKFSQAFLKTNSLTLASKGVRKALKELKPDILICSHLHEAEGIEEKIDNTLVINVGRKGKIIEI